MKVLLINNILTSLLFSNVSHLSCTVCLTNCIMHCGPLLIAHKLILSFFFDGNLSLFYLLIMAVHYLCVRNYSLHTVCIDNITISLSLPTAALAATGDVICHIFLF